MSTALGLNHADSEDAPSDPPPRGTLARRRRWYWSHVSIARLQSDYGSGGQRNDRERREDGWSMIDGGWGRPAMIVQQYSVHRISTGAYDNTGGGGVIDRGDDFYFRLLVFDSKMTHSHTAWMTAIIARSNVASGARVVAERKQARAVPGVSGLFPSSVPCVPSGDAALIRLTAFGGSQPRVRVKAKRSRGEREVAFTCFRAAAGTVQAGQQGRQGQGSPRTMR